MRFSLNKIIDRSCDLMMWEYDINKSLINLIPHRERYTMDLNILDLCSSHIYSLGEVMFLFNKGCYFKFTLIFVDYLIVKMIVRIANFANF